MPDRRYCRGREPARAANSFSCNDKGGRDKTGCQDAARPVIIYHNCRQFANWSLGKRPPGKVIPLALGTALVPRAIVDQLADLLEHPPRLIAPAALLQEHRIAATRLLAWVGDDQRLVFLQGRIGLALSLEAAGIEEMAV